MCPQRASCSAFIPPIHYIYREAQKLFRQNGQEKWRQGLLSSHVLYLSLSTQVCRSQGPVLCETQRLPSLPIAGTGFVPLQSQPSPPIAGAGLVPALNNVPTSFKNISNIICGPAQDRPLRSVSNLPNLNSFQRFCFVLLPIFDGI